VVAVVVVVLIMVITIAVAVAVAPVVLDVVCLMAQVVVRLCLLKQLIQLQQGQPILSK
jgi:hypothetical protein